MEVCEPRDFTGLMYVESKSVFFQKKAHYAAYILYFEPLVIIVEYHIFAFMRFVTANINVVKAQILDLVTIFVRSVGGLKSMYLTTMLF